MTTLEFGELFFWLSLIYGENKAMGMIYADMPETAKKFLPDLVVVDSIEALDCMIGLGMQPSRLRLEGEVGRRSNNG